MGEALEKAQRARNAARALAKTDTTTRNRALEAMAAALEARTDYLLAQNALDVRAAREKGTDEPLVDRLLLTADRIGSIAAALRTLALQSDPLGTVTEGRTLYNGIRLRRVRVPLGVVAIIYEARPNVTADAAGLSLKT
ncbi:MAG: gamma-glutamyl-phosphate reductase, partial [Coriobacteriales bacterium]|nr:gamma-glutamyl-phosphate reductase [Coriobacteriales bacterium]